MLGRMRDSKGLTLIEVIVSVAILGIIIVPLSSLFTHSIKINLNSKDRMTANHVAQQYMEELKFSSNTVIGSQTITDPDTGFVVETKVEPFMSSTYSTDIGQEDTNSYSATIVLEGEREGYLNIDNREIDFSDTDTMTLTVDSSRLDYVITPTEGSNIRTGSIGISQEGSKNLKVLCKGRTRLNMKVVNKESQAVNFYIVKGKKQNSNAIGENIVKLDVESGKINSYYNIYDSSVLTEEQRNGNTQRLYKATVTVKKDDKELISIWSLRSVR